MRSTNQSHVLKGVLFTLFAALGFALSLVLARLSYEHGSNPASVMFIRFAAMAIVLLLWTGYQNQSLRLNRVDTAGSLGCGLLYFTGIFAYLSSVAWLQVSLAVLIFYTFPIVVALIVAANTRQPPNGLSLIALLVAFSGLLLALNVRSAEVSIQGLAFAIFASVAIACNIVFSSRVLQRVPTQVFSSYTASLCAVLSALAVFTGEGLQLPQNAVGATVFLGMLLAFFVGFICTFNAIACLGSLRFASLMNLEPVATIVFALLILGETLSLLQALGAAIVIIAVVLAQYASEPTV